MKYMELQKQIGATHIHHCYLFYGEEKYRIKKTVRSLTDKILGPDKNSFNYQVFYGRETTGATIAQAALTFPFLSRKKLLIIKETEVIADLENLLRVVDNPPTHCYMIFLADKVDFRKKFYAAFRKMGTDVIFWRPFENELPRLIRQSTNEQGYKITPEAVDLLIDLCGTDLMQLENELEKITLYVGEKKTIHGEDVEEVGGGGECIHNIFELTHSIGNGNLARAIGIINQLLLTGEPPLKILAMIVRQFRNIWQGKQMLSQGDSPEKIRQKLRVYKPTLRSFLNQTRRFNDRSLEKVFKILLDYDFRFKSSCVPSRLLMELLIIDLCRL